MEMNRDEPDISDPPHNFIQMLNSLIQSDNIIFRAELENIEENISHTSGGCSEEYINNLGEFIVDEEFLKKDLQCSICLDDFKKDDKCILLPCKENSHFFHSGCDTCSGIKEWLKRKNTCPMCRTEFPKENVYSEPILSGSGRTSDILQSITLNTSIIPPINNNESEDTIIENDINPNDLENRISNIITSYINEIEQSNIQRDMQIAIQESFNDY